MSGNIKFRWFFLAPILVALFFVASPVSWAGAIEDAQEQVRQNPDYANAHHNLGNAYKKSGQYQEAIASYKEAIRLNPNLAEAHMGLGLIYSSFEPRQYQEASASFKEAIRIKPDDSIAHYGLGYSYYFLGQYKEAIASLKEAIRIKPDDAMAHYLLGNAYRHSGQNQDAITSYEEAIRLKPDFYIAHYGLGRSYYFLGQYKEAIASYKEAIRIEPDHADVHISLGNAYYNLGQYKEAVASFKEAMRIKPDDAMAHGNLGNAYGELGRYKEAIASFKEVIRIKPDDAMAHNNLGYTYEDLGRNDEAIAFYKEALRIDPNHTLARNNLNALEQKTADERLALEQRLLKEERKKHKALQNLKEADRLARERKLLEEERKRLEAIRLAEENRKQQPSIQPPEEQAPQSGSGSGFFVSKMGHVITNAHVVQNCNKVTIGDNANKQVPAEVVNTDKSNDLALLKLSTLEMASAESKSLIQKLGIVVVPLASKGLLRSEDVRLGEKILVAGYPFGDAFSNSIKVTTGVVSSIRGVGDDSGQFQLDAAVQPGNSGGPIYDSSGNIVGVVIAQLNKRTFGSLVENVNFGVKASTVRQFLISSGLSSKKSERTEEKSTEQLAEIAKNQALMVMCLQ